MDMAGVNALGAGGGHVINPSTGSLGRGYSCMRLLCWLSGQLESEVGGMTRAVSRCLTNSPDSVSRHHFTAFADRRQCAQGPRGCCGRVDGDWWFSAVELTFFVPGAFVVIRVLMGEATDHATWGRVWERRNRSRWNKGTVDSHPETPSRAFTRPLTLDVQKRREHY